MGKGCMRMAEEWIKCSDRLPEDERSVIIFYKWKGYKGKIEKTIVSGKFFYRDKKWRQYDDEWGDIETDKEITHWMPCAGIKYQYPLGEE